MFLIGCDGLIGKALQTQWFHGNLIFTSRRVETQASSKMIWDLTTPIPPFSLHSEDVVVLAAAMTSVEACEKNPKLAHRVNVEAAVEVADLCAQRGARLVFLSSSAVFDGTKINANESDETCPQNEYGRTKAEAERLIHASGARYLILRLTKVLNPAGGYLASLLQSLAQGQRVKASPDLPVAPLSLSWVVGAITKCLDFKEGGIFHLSPKNETNYFDLAEKAAIKYGLNQSLIQRQPLAELHQRLPQIYPHAALNTKKAGAELGLSFPLWEEALDK